MSYSILFLLLLGFSPDGAEGGKGFQFEEALSEAESAFVNEDYRGSLHWIQRALERDPNSCEAWKIRALSAEAIKDKDLQTFSLHQRYRLAVAQKLPKKEIEQAFLELIQVDPLAEEYYSFWRTSIKKLLPLAEYYEKEGRPHSAIKIYNQILAMSPEQSECREAIERIASAPDPSLADSAREKDLLADVSETWIKDHDKKHSDWKDRVKLERANYTTVTNAGYEVLVRTAEVTENANIFFRNFFNFGTDEHPGTVPRLELWIFKSKEDYQKFGSSTKDWTRGVFTGPTIETYVAGDGFKGMITTLFHEITHQFVRAATKASGTLWLNEGLATYFEGTRVLPNGAVQMNLPEDSRLSGLVKRMELGWMKDSVEELKDVEPDDVMKVPAPPMEMVIAGKYEWGPPWYGPVWGLTYFFFNYQDPVDGRFIYREAYRNYINEFGGRSGSGAVKKIEEMVLGKPAKPTKGIYSSEEQQQVHLPKTLKEIDETWKEFLVKLKKERAGSIKVDRPYHQWARYAVVREDWNTAREHFEQALQDTPDDVELLMDFAQFLVSQSKNSDRAVKLMLDALRVLERQDEPDEATIKAAEKLLTKWDPKRRQQIKVREEFFEASHEWVEKYLSGGHNMMAMDLSWRFGVRLGIKGMMASYEKAYRDSEHSLWNWKLAYNERNLRDWMSTREEEAFIPDDGELKTSVDRFEENVFNYALLTLDKVTSNDYSLEAEFKADANRVKFCGLVIGNKGTQTCQAIIFHPPRSKAGKTRTAYLDLASFSDDNTFGTHRHYPVKVKYSTDWHKLRVDVAGKVVDVWFNGKLIMSHEYTSLPVLHGQFGIVSGVGEAKFRNIRYLVREPGDPTAKIERRIRFEKINSGALAQGASIDGSWLNRKPAWLEHVKWVQGERSSWTDMGPVPTLLAFWSVEQNSKVPIDGWLRHVVRQYEDAGLNVISVVSAGNEKSIANYLKTTSFPGAVCLDKFLKRGYGHNFERFGIGKFFELPRILLLDIDHRTAWEGDPGFSTGKMWTEGTGSYLDTPLMELVERRRLKTFSQWFKDWCDWGEEEMRNGNVEKAAELLMQSQLFTAEYHPKVKDAHDKLYKLQIELESIETMSRKLSELNGEPALDIVLKWSKLLEKSPDPKVLKSLKSVIKGDRAKEWTKTLAQVRRTRKALKEGKEIDQTRKLLDKITKYNGLFPDMLKSRLAEAADSEDQDAARQILENAENLPARWLAEEYFKW